jgi:hypothetical protein
MADQPSDRSRLDALLIERQFLVEQIRQSKLTVERSQELLRRLDELLAKDAMKP